MRREGRITIFEHPEEGGEAEGNHLAEGSANIVKGLIRTPKSSAESNVERDGLVSHADSLGSPSTPRSSRTGTWWVPTAELPQRG